MNADDARIENMLARYRPVGPPPALRDRVLQWSGSQRSAWAIAGWLSMAAMLMLCVGLHWATQRLTRETLTRVSTPVEWTDAAEGAVRLLDGNGEGRRYLAFALAARIRHTEPFPRPAADAGFQGDIR